MVDNNKYNDNKNNDDNNNDDNKSDKTHHQKQLLQIHLCFFALNFIKNKINLAINYSILL